MQLQNGSLTVDLSKKRRSSKTSAPIPQEFVMHIPTIELLGRKFWVMGEPWVDPDCFGVPCPTDITPDSPQRYATPQSTKQGVIAELYAFVPRKLHKMMQDAPFFHERVCDTSRNEKPADVSSSFAKHWVHRAQILFIVCDNSAIISLISLRNIWSLSTIVLTLLNSRRSWDSRKPTVPMRFSHRSFIGMKILIQVRSLHIHLCPR
jgi:hypothetical protein